MSSKAYIQLSKHGDILSVLPIFHDEFKTSGNPVNLVVAREYASTVEGLDYINPVIYSGASWDFKSAYQFAKTKFDNVVVTQTQIQCELGKVIPIERHTPSCFLEMWRRAGCLGKWDSLPLILPRTGKTQLSGPSIFYSDHSQSSPFFFREDLFKLLQDTFPTHQIMRASGMRLKNIRDFLPIMDACDLIVSVETSFLHLAKATATPIIAMVSDSPDPWRGSPYSKHFAFHCRYGDFMARKVELVAAMNRAVNKVEPTNLKIFPSCKSHGYNLAIADGFNIYRYHPNGTWKTKLAIQIGGTADDIVFPKECDDCSMEDARWFTINGAPHISYTCSKAIGGKFCCVQSYGPISLINGTWKVTKHIVPKYIGNDFSGMVKNWVFFERAGKLFAIFGNLKATMEQVVLELEGGKVVKEHRSKAPEWSYGGIRGGCVVPYRGQLLRFFHSRLGDTHRPLGFRYYVGAALMSAEPPFETKIVSSFPILAGNEKYAPNCRSWKPNCALPYGVIADGERFKVSVGLNDCECAILDLGVVDLNL